MSAENAPRAELASGEDESRVRIGKRGLVDFSVPFFHFTHSVHKDAILKTNRGTLLVFCSRSRTTNSKAFIQAQPNSVHFPHRSAFFNYLIYGDVFIGSPEIEEAAVVAKKRTSTSSSFCNFSKFGRMLS